MVFARSLMQISRRTKDALAAAKRRGVKLGGYRAGSKLTAKARKAGQEANARIAAENCGATGGRRYVIAGYRSGPECPWNSNRARYRFLVCDTDLAHIDTALDLSGFDKAIVVAKLKGVRERARRAPGQVRGRKGYAEREGRGRRPSRPPRRRRRRVILRCQLRVSRRRFAIVSIAPPSAAGTRTCSCASLLVLLLLRWCHVDGLRPFRYPGFFVHGGLRYYVLAQRVLDLPVEP
jgi:hypothetical protein